MLAAVAATAVALAGWWVIGQNRTARDFSRAASRSVSDRPRPIAASGEAYALGRHLLFNLRAEDVLVSRSQLETAVRLNPELAEAFAALALNYQLSAVLGLSTRDTGMAKSREMVTKALELAPDSAASELALATQSALLEEDYAASEPHFRVRLSTDPNQAAARADGARQKLSGNAR